MRMKAAEKVAESEAGGGAGGGVSLGGSQSWSNVPQDGRRDRQRHGRPALLRAAGRVRRRPRSIEIVTFCEEPRPAYDRVSLTKYFAHRDAEKLTLAELGLVREERHRAVRRRPGRRRSTARRKVVRSAAGPRDRLRRRRAGDRLVPRSCRRCRASTSRASSSTARSRTWSGSSPTRETAKRAAVIGGGLLGLEAAKAAYDLGLETHVVEFAPRLMPRQVDDAGSKVLVGKIESARRAGPPQQEHQGGPRQRQGRGHGVHRRQRARRRDGHRLGRHPAARRAGPALRADGRPARRRGRRRRSCARPTRTSSPSARWPCTAA